MIQTSKNKYKKWAYILGATTIILLLIIIGFFILRNYGNNIAEQQIYNIALQQTNTKNFLFINNNTISYIPLQNLCEAFKLR